MNMSWIWFRAAAASDGAAPARPLARPNSPTHDPLRCWPHRNVPAVLASASHQDPQQLGCGRVHSPRVDCAATCRTWATWHAWFTLTEPRTDCRSLDACSVQAHATAGSAKPTARTRPAGASHLKQAPARQDGLAALGLTDHQHPQDAGIMSGRAWPRPRWR